ncbi:hypothetical protein BDI4_1120031 [Burkholderia diffusa]|nr:hypothetical protein BDI4_1120031 [Burkholderia diffusa]
MDTTENEVANNVTKRAIEMILFTYKSPALCHEADSIENNIC